MTLPSPATDPVPEPTRTADDLDPVALAAIREMLADEKVQETPPAPAVARSADPVPGGVASSPSPPVPPQTVPAAPRISAERAAAPPAAAPSRTTPHRGRIAERVAETLALGRARVLGYRPTPRHVLLTALALLVWFRPLLLVGLVCLSLILLTTVVLVLGYDGVWLRAMQFARWHADRDPARRAARHRRLDRFAARWDALLDRFPEGTVDGLYLPDFGDRAEADARHDAVLARRLGNLRQGGT